jgi:hypothetical protein
MTIKVRRHAACDSSISHDLGEANVFVECGRLFVAFSEQKGFGTSVYKLRIDPGSYGYLVQAMLRVNAEETIKAFAAALKDGIPAPIQEEDFSNRWWPSLEKKASDAA